MEHVAKSKIMSLKSVKVKKNLILGFGYYLSTTS